MYSSTKLDDTFKVEKNEHQSYVARQKLFVLVIFTIGWKRFERNLHARI